MRVLFICKKNETYGFTTYTRRSSGLYNSTRFIVEALLARGIHAHIIEVIDNNCIDREVTKYRPDLVVIEALWVVPEKFPVLRKLHPKVRWFVHMHSGMPFLALEGSAMDWLARYPEVGVGIIANSPESYDAFRCFLPRKDVAYLPNVYLSRPMPAVIGKKRHHLNVGCFGAVRPMKNHLLQALAAMRLADKIGKPLRFHINASRIEVGGHPVMKNLLQLFAHQKKHALVQHRWMEPDEFLHLLHTEVDLGLQVSLTETFNVVSADYVTAGIPVVASKEVKWLSRFSKAEDDSIDDIVWVSERALRSPCLVRRNQKLLRSFAEKAARMWSEFVRR